MRWEELFRDLEAQLDAAAAAELDAEVADRTRREAALLVLVDRARAALAHPVVVRVRGVGALEGVLVDVGAQWLLLAEGGNRQALVPLDAIVSLSGLRAWTEPAGSAGQVVARLGLGTALRGIARDRDPVQVWLVDGSVAAGTLDRVGADFVELTEHAAGEPRRGREGFAVRTIPFAALAAVRGA